MELTLAANHTFADPREQVDHLIEMLGSHLEHVRSRRGADRYPLNVPIGLGVRLAGMKQFTPLYKCWGLDMSMHGVGLIVEHQVPTRMKMFADFEALAGETCLVPVRILYCRPLLTNTFQVGAVFLWLAD